MDTPERTQIGTQIPQFEDSPVFSFINSLSPIKPVKSTHVTQTLNSLSFSSLPSVFTSPHLTSQKDSKFLRRHTIADPTKLLISSEHVSSFGPLNEEPRRASLRQILKYDCSSPRRDSMSYCGIEAESSTTLVPYNLIVSEQCLLEGERDLQVVCGNEKRERETECEWESSISNATELGNFYSPNGTKAFEGTIQISQDREGNNDLDKSQLVNPIYPCEVPKMEDPSTQPEEVSVLNNVNPKLAEFASTSTRLGPTNDPSEEMDTETVSNLHRGLRRRCLVFEMGGARAKNFINSSTYSSSMVPQCNEEIASIDNQLVPIKPGGKTSQRIIPGIGLHLNALTQMPKNLKAVKHETLAIGEQLDVHNSSLVHSPITGEIVLNDSLVPASCERDTNLHGNDNQGDEDALQVSSEIAPEDSDQISPKKKRCRFEHVGENEGCKRCNCKKSKCLKLYCECFAAGVYCIEPCSCQECFNKPVHEETVLATRKQIEIRNPLAFAPKVIKTSDYVPDNVGESNQTPASARHKRGCNCKKSGCLKKYCECYQSGVGCSINCRCESCKNVFGIKEGYCPIETEAEPAEEEILELEKTTDKDLRKPQIQSNDKQNAASAHPSTPLHLSRLSTQLPISTKSKLQRSFTTGSSIGLQHCPKLTNANFLRPQPKFEKNIQTIPKENEIPEILQTNSTPLSGIKSSSPNSKRVSPPHSDFGSSSSSPGRRSSRKLILQSIPSFPSLNSQP